MFSTSTCAASKNDCSESIHVTDRLIQVNDTVAIDNNLYSIITEWVRIGKHFHDRDEIIQAILNEYEDRYLRQYNCPKCSKLIQNPNPGQEQLFKPKIASERTYTSRKVYAELDFIYTTNRYHIRSLLFDQCPCCEPCCAAQTNSGNCNSCSSCPQMNYNYNSVDEYIKNLIKNNYEQALTGLNKTSIMMTLPQHINRNDFDNKMKSICVSDDPTIYRLKPNLEIL